MPIDPGVSVDWTLNNPRVVRKQAKDPPAVGIFDNPTRCYIINHEWAKHLIGAVHALADYGAWTGDLDERNNAVQAVYEFLIGDSCNVFELRQNPNNDCQLQQSLDGGETWTTVFDYSLCPTQPATPDTLQSLIDALDALNTAYDGTVASVAPDMVYDATATDDTRDIALCHAVTELVNLMCEMEKEYRRQIALLSTITGVILGLIGIALTVASLGSATPFYLAVSGALASGFGILFGGLSESVLDDLTARGEVVCCMTNALAGATITQTAFEQSLDNCGFTAGTNEAQLAGAIDQLLTQDDMYVTFLDYMQQSFRLAELGIATCDCFIGWIYTNDFLATQDSWTWNTNVSPTGTWAVTTGWTTSDWTVGDGSFRRTTSIERTFTASAIEQVKMTYDLTLGNQVAENYLSVIAYKTGGTQVRLDILGTDLVSGNNQVATLNLDEPDIEKIRLTLSCSRTTDGTFSGSLEISDVEVRGTGTDPF